MSKQDLDQWWQQQLFLKTKQLLKMENQQPNTGALILRLVIIFLAVFAIVCGLILLFK